MGIVNTVKNLLNIGTRVDITFKVPNSDFAAAYVGKTRLSFVNGEASINLPSGEHFLTWSLHGQPGASYQIAITAPDNCKWKPVPDATVDTDGKDAGTHKFTVKEA